MEKGISICYARQAKEIAMDEFSIREGGVGDIRVRINGKDLTTKSGVVVADLLEQAPHRGEFPPLAAVVENGVYGLYYQLRSDTDVETVDLSDREGMDVYRRSATLILCAAMHEIDPHARLVVGQSLLDNYFFEIHGREIAPELLRKLEEKMRSFVAADIMLIPQWTTVEESIRLMGESGQHDKETLLSQARRFEVPIVTLGSFRTYAAGPLAMRTGLIERFKLHHYEHGLVLGFPDKNGNLAETIPPQPMLFNTYVETKRWNELIGASNVAQLNELIARDKVAELIQVSEAFHERKVADISDAVVARKKDVRLILIAGPSCSGKTTFTRRIGVQLRMYGIEPVMISIDNYYVDREKTPRHPDGSYDFECLEALDLKLFNDHIQRLINGEKVDTPVYNFSIGKRDPYKKHPMKLGKNQVLITEGIHGLNDALTTSVPSDKKFKIYLSALTQLCIDDHNRIFTTDTRLIRRIIRDKMFRGTGAADTIVGWPSVRSGEAKLIFPYQEGSDFVFNSALPYEHAVLKPYAERFLAEVPREHPSFMEVMRLYRFFAMFTPILSAEVPHTSILREFIGKSVFRYG